MKAREGALRKLMLPLVPAVLTASETHDLLRFPQRLTSIAHIYKLVVSGTRT